MEQKKLWAVSGGILAVVALVGYVSWLKYGGSELYQKNSGNASSTAISSSTATSTSPIALKKDTGGSHPGLSYTEAVRYYENRRIQFDPNCVATPNSISLKNGTLIMFDNRSPESRTIALDGTRYLIRGYDFRLLKATSNKLPHVVLVDCGSGRNNAQIILQ